MTMRRSLLVAGVSALMTLIVPLSPSFVHHRRLARSAAILVLCRYDCWGEGSRRKDARARLLGEDSPVPVRRRQQGRIPRFVASRLEASAIVSRRFVAS
jgi:hypothetical protein